MIDKELNKFNFVPLNEYNFVGRTEYSNEISKKLGNTPKNDHKNTLIVGTSGIGKTALAIMDNNKNQYNSTYFFISKNKEILNKDYRLFAMSVKLEVEKKQDQEVIEIVKGYLFRNNGWLLVYDNVDKPKMSKNDLEQYNGNGHIIITSQNSSGWLELLVIKLGKLKREESKNLFNNLKKIDDSVNADILSDLIEDYPTCIFQLGMHIRNYYDWYDKLIKEYKKIGGIFFNEDDKSIKKLLYRAIELNINKLKENESFDWVQLLIKLLCIASDHINFELIEKLGGENSKKYISILKSHSMLENTKKNGDYKMHRVVQEIIR